MNSEGWLIVFHFESVANGLNWLKGLVYVTLLGQNITCLNKNVWNLNIWVYRANLVSVCYFNQ